jgi:RNA polymerase sigma-70 factor (ECF subfamily)
MVNGALAISDGELFVRARDGDQTAFGELIDRHKDNLVSYLTYLCGDFDRAEDLAQEAFIRLYERGAGYRDQGKLQAYLFRIATNLFRSEIRRDRRRSQLRQIFLSPSQQQYEIGQDQRLLSSELGNQLAAALTQLPLHFRTPLILAYVEGWSHREIARVIGCRQGTVKTRIHRGRRLLRQQLETYQKGSR